ncbi:MAG: hypothetical protein JO100_02395 [Pseudonocardia sp.]|nr:hypothetical protein [Pseudonocardia sp.]
MPVLAERLGPARSVGWFLSNMPRYERTRKLFGEALRQAGLDAEIPWVNRLLELATGARDLVDRDDARLMHLIAMFVVLNSRGIAGDIEPDETHDPLNKDVALKARYAKPRAESIG